MSAKHPSACVRRGQRRCGSAIAGNDARGRSSDRGPSRGARHAERTSQHHHVTDDDWDEVVDRNWDPPVTMGVRAMSVLEDSAKHLGQAEYVRGILLRRR
jgi:hypothetical protein